VNRSRKTTATILCAALLSGIVRADDIADVEAAEMGFNAAQNAGSIARMAEYFLDGRTIFAPFGGGLIVGWTEESLAQRQAEFDAGREINYRIENLEIRVFGATAVTAFERVGTVKEIGSVPVDSHLRISGVWVKVDGQWKLAHRHESPF